MCASSSLSCLFFNYQRVCISLSLQLRHSFHIRSLNIIHIFMGFAWQKINKRCIYTLFIVRTNSFYAPVISFFYQLSWFWQRNEENCMKSMSNMCIYSSTEQAPNRHYHNNSAMIKHLCSVNKYLMKKILDAKKNRMESRRWHKKCARKQIQNKLQNLSIVLNYSFISGKSSEPLVG